jgi:hypothetical protein
MLQLALAGLKSVPVTVRDGTSAVGKGGSPPSTVLSPVRPCRELCGSYPSGPVHVLLDADLRRVAPTPPGAWMLETRKRSQKVLKGLKITLLRGH